jgi:hypothetical protein
VEHTEDVVEGVLVCAAEGVTEEVGEWDGLAAAERVLRAG